MMQQQQAWPQMQAGGYDNYEYGNHGDGGYGREGSGQRGYGGPMHGGPMLGGPMPMQPPPPFQHQQLQVQAGTGGAARSTSERPVDPHAPHRRPQDGPPVGTGKHPRTSLDILSRRNPLSGLTAAQLTCEEKKPEPTPERG